MASDRVSLHISELGRSDTHTAGRCGEPNSAHRISEVSWTHGTPAALPKPSVNGMPGIGLEIDGAVQQAPQPGRQIASGEGVPSTGKTVL